MRQAALLAAIGLAALVAHPARPAVTEACTADAAGKLVGPARRSVTVRVPAVRRFAVEVPVEDIVVSSVRFSATGGIRLRRVPARTGYSLRLTAPRVGPFRVRATWTQQSGRGGYACTASGSVRLRATAG